MEDQAFLKLASQDSLTIKPFVLKLVQLLMEPTFAMQRGKLSFGEFTNQIEYQDVGAALNRAMKADILEDLDRTTLTGKIVEITGVFRLINAKNWLVTPVRMNLK